MKHSLKGIPFEAAKQPPNPEAFSLGRRERPLRPYEPPASAASNCSSRDCFME